MVERAVHDVAQRALPGVAEGSVAQVVAQGDRLGQVLVEHQRPGDRAGQARDLQGVGQAGAVMVALRLKEDLGLVLQAPEGFRVGDAVHVPLEAGADRAGLLRAQPPPGVLGQHAVRADQFMLQLFPLLAQTCHRDPPLVSVSIPIYDIARHFPF